MTKKLRREDLGPLKDKLDYIASQTEMVRHGLIETMAEQPALERVEGDIFVLRETLSDHNEQLSQIQNTLSRWPAGMDLERIETLLNGVRFALERVGGNVIPGMVTDIHALRDQMAEFRRELAGYRSTLMTLSNWLDTVSSPPPQPEPVVVAARRTRKSRKNTQKSQPQMEISGLDAASHNGTDEDEAVSP